MHIQYHLVNIYIYIYVEQIDHFLGTYGTLINSIYELFTRTIGIKIILQNMDVCMPSCSQTISIIIEWCNDKSIKCNIAQYARTE